MSEPPPAPPEEEPSGPGPRRVALRARRRRRRRRAAVRGLVVLLLAGVIAGGGAWWLAREDVPEDGDSVTGPIPETGEDALSSALLFGSSEAGAPASFLTLLSVDPEAGRAAVVYIPAATAVEVPGRGLQGVGSALGTGGVSLLRVAVENLLGVEIDSQIHLTAADTDLLMSALAPLEVDVPNEVRVRAGRGEARLLFDTGPQRLSGSQLAELLFTVGMGGDEVELGARHLAFWDALLDTFHPRAGSLGEQVGASEVAFRSADVPVDEIAGLFEALAAVDPARRTLAILPVRQVSVGGGELYAADRAEIAAFLTETLGGTARSGTLVDVQILNGNGVPGIGQEVAEKLVGEGFRIALTGNAPRLDYARTLIVTYDRSDAGLAVARRVRDLLGVGRIRVSAQEQGSVDVTIVVGKDFLGIPNDQ